ncbi:MAG: membrane protein insertase YidC [Clostridia bacterium]|nr:membrane protein insertase YidC [Clostridia bacterium]
MELLATLSQVVTEYLVKGIGSIHMNWIGQVIKWIIEGVGITGLGVIVFTLALKTIVLPLDVYSRVKQKKQSLIMKEMRPQMEKLQKQYANDKTMYNQKVMELQKRSGYSVLSSCLPMIVSLVIFFIVFAQFSVYSQYANLESYNKMVKEYNASVESYVYDMNENEDGFLIVYNEQLGYADLTPFSGDILEANASQLTSDGYWNGLVDWDETGEGLDKSYVSFFVDFDAFYEEYTNDPETYGDPFADAVTETDKLAVVDEYVEGKAADAVEVYYTSKEARRQTRFLWVGNIWYPDSMLNKEVPSFSNFRSTISRADIGDYEASYNKVTASLTQQKSRYNGYFILIVLAIGGMLLQQFISMRSTKDANELSTVDGQGARTNKYMMIIMPIIYGIFSFFYSASFSLYMIVNTLYSTLSMVVTNKVVDYRYNKKREKTELEKMNRHGADS